MLRKSARLSGRLAVSALLSWSLIPIAVADAPTPASAENSESSKAAAAPAKRLFTVPEDGMGDEQWLSGATPVAREILVKRSKEDLVICLAGCLDKQDLVVYAQPTAKRPKPPAAVSDAVQPDQGQFVPSASVPDAAEETKTEATDTDNAAPGTAEDVH